MVEIVWNSEVIEPDPRGRRGEQVSYGVRGADAAWAQRFNEVAEAQRARGELRGGRWGAVRYDEVEAVLTVDDFYEDDTAALRQHLRVLL
jgi:hypothetical protein